jgi:YidC/Oxa1 family membrane protein insertase
MTDDNRRLVLFLVLAFALMMATQALMGALGLLPRPVRKPPAPAAAAAQGEPAKGAEGAPPVAKVPAAAAPAAPAQNQPAPAAAAAKVVEVNPHDLALGSLEKSKGYRLAVQLSQKGAGVATVLSSLFNAEFVDGPQRVRPLELIMPDRNPDVPPSFAMTVAPAANQAADQGAAKLLGAPPEGFLPLDSRLWEVDRDAQGKAVRTFSDTNPVTKVQGEGQEITFRTTLGQPAVTVTKRYRLWKDADGFEFEIGLESPSGDQTLVYELMGPHGIPIEGEWYARTFRDVFFAQRGVDLKTHSAADVVKAKDNPNPLSASPLLFAGVENQYFAVFLEPYPLPATNKDSRIQETIATVIHEDTANPQKADVSVQIKSKPIEVGPNRSATHSYVVFAGPKRPRNLAPYGADELASYRKSSLPIVGPLAMVASRYVISPLLDQIHRLTDVVAHWFGGQRGSYGIAIILLTITVRLLMFPLSRKQAISAKKMQDLQPLMAELKEKYKEDKERMTKETFALYKQHGVNPMGGCLPALIQLPIFIGLWQSLNNSVDLRHATFLWIKNLAAPDMLFKFPFPIPLVGSFLGDYFNLLPFLVVALMLVQTKLFSPPPTTPEAEMQMKMMKYMMIFMAFMFYTVPSGLGLYFITSSLWAIGERLLLPKMTAHVQIPRLGGGESEPPPSGGGGSGRGGRGGPGGNGEPRGWLAQRIEKLLEEAAHDRTVRNENPQQSQEKRRPQSRPGKRR